MQRTSSKGRILITGGAGFIGGHLARALAASGEDVTVLDDLRVPPMIPPEGTGKFLEKPVLELDERDLLDVRLVYHLASHKSVPRSFKQPLAYLDNLDSGRHLLALCTSTGVGKVVVGSTCEVYGQADVLPTPETSPLSPRSPYAASKVGLEMVTGAHQRACGAPEVGIVRFFNVYGPGERPDALIPRLCANLLARNELPVEGDGEQRRDFTYIPDVVDKLVALAGRPLPRVVNFGSGHSFSVNDVVRILQSASPGAGIAERRPRPNEIAEFRANTALQTRHLGARPLGTGLEEGIRLTLAWWQSRGPDDVLQRIFQEEGAD
ncbi:NAD-dependent epimerase/dehydratase family protein [Streptomyces sp. NBC_00083]|uniref:NAD-dependent epimerase/dehydratase family protein n=1 Tax=Streptomyces sp. NBC_00083 TaxID=2975647 RepID=UPI002255BCB6|nr:NAD-dependent epimerase/dehydratase family protein [Streptomyces sp. NBC_00083]MCX5387347.1 NAD-dependent epimerase/dehydratase family protein [Streptomyces sp. NBC_00083]